MQTVKLNLIPGSVLPVVNVSQYDEKRQFALQVYEGATAYSLSGKSVQIRGTKPDGNGFAYDATDGVVSVSGNTVTISTTQQMTAVGGQTMAELRITSGDTILGTLNFILMVEPSALSDDTPISDTDIPAIERDFEAALAEAEADALVAEGYAKGTQGGVPVTSESPYYNNNAEHFKDEAEAAASDVLEKYPKIVNDYWYVWDIDADQYVNTGVRAKGTQGDPGAPGQGVPAGGTTGQVLKKASDSDYDTEWGTGGGGADALDDLTDVNLISPADGDLLQYNGTSREWGNSRAVPDAIDALEETGAVNLLPHTAVSEVRQGVTFTVNPSGYPDGAIMLSSSAAPTGGIDYQVNSGFKLKAGTYYLFQNNYPSTGRASRISVTIKNGPELAYDANYDHTHRTFTLTQETELIYHIYANSNGTIGALNNVVIYPMISLIPNADYQPYAMTNRELTEAVSPYEYDVTLASGVYLAVTGSKAMAKIGKLVMINFAIKGVVANQDTWVNVGTVPAVCAPKQYKTLNGRFSNPTDGTSFEVQVLDSRVLRLTCKTRAVVANDWILIYGSYWV